MNENANRRKLHPTNGVACSMLAMAMMWLCHCPQALAQEPIKSTEPIEAEAVGAIASCSVCHGPQGEGNAVLGAPRIGGMAEWYLSRQLHHFRQGIRGATDEDAYGTQMRAMALALDDLEEADELARYLSMLAPPEAPKIISGDVKRGKQVYGVCTACHGADGRGSKTLNAPALQGQYDWYLVRQLNNYRNGLRGTNQEDTYGMQMAPIAKTLTDEQDIKDVVAYINTL